MHFREKEFRLLTVVYVMSWLMLALSGIGLVIAINEFVLTDNVAGTTLAELILIGFLAVVVLLSVLLIMIVTPRLKQLQRIKSLTGGLATLLHDNVPIPTTYLGTDGSTILVEEATEESYYYDLTIKPAEGPTANWEVGRFRINDKKRVRDPLSLSEMGYVQRVYDLIKAEVELHDEQRDRAERQARLQEVVDEHNARTQAPSTAV